MSDISIWVKKVKSCLSNYDSLIKTLIAISALVIAGLQSCINFSQLSINNRLKQLQDTVTIALLPMKEGTLKLLNTGRNNLHLHGYDMPGDSQWFDDEEARLITAGTGDSSYYWLPSPQSSYLKRGEKFTIMLYLKDDFGQMWISKLGGQMDFAGQGGLRVWSYKTQRAKWQKPEPR